MTVTRELVLAVADWWEKQDGGDTNQPYADRLRSAAMWADPTALRLSANDEGRTMNKFQATLTEEMNLMQRHTNVRAELGMVRAWGRTFELPEDGEEVGELLRDFTYEPKFVGVVFR